MLGPERQVVRTGAGGSTRAPSSHLDVIKCGTQLSVFAHATLCQGLHPEGGQFAVAVSEAGTQRAQIACMHMHPANAGAREAGLPWLAVLTAVSPCTGQGYLLAT